MYRVVLLALCVVVGVAGADVPHPFIREAEMRYQRGDYAGATRYLLAVPGMLYMAPAVTPMDAPMRARVFFDLGCTYLASGDSARADRAFKEAFALNDRLKQGYFEQADPGTLWWALHSNEELSRRMKTTRLSAARRSMAIPGWGQFYRGHKKKGYAFLGATFVTSGLLALQYREFKIAHRAYRQTTPGIYLPARYINEDGTHYTEWEARYRKASSSARRVNVMLGVLGAVYLLNVIDSATFGPAQMGLSFEWTR